MMKLKTGHGEPNYYTFISNFTHRMKAYLWHKLRVSGTSPPGLSRAGVSAVKPGKYD